MKVRGVKNLKPGLYSVHYTGYGNVGPADGIAGYFTLPVDFSVTRTKHGHAQVVEAIDDRGRVRNIYLSDYGISPQSSKTVSVECNLGHEHTSEHPVYSPYYYTERVEV